uniref:JmjC domain-containing protein n=1 Tax=Peronospora matthiolae TaxID=2874970 RepID=A0AAV1TZJ4_9STRA
MSSSVAAALGRLQSDTQDFWAPLHAIRRVDALRLTPLQFHREFVSRNAPVVLRNAMTSALWRRALVKWQDDAHLVTKAGDALVTVNMTPFGIGDAVLEVSPNGHEGIFVMPEERDLTFANFLELLHTRNERQGVPYLSHQNDSLRDQLPGLFEEVPAAIELAVEAFGNEPEAVNIWIGDERVVSTMHKDHYENMYCVVKGQKHFTLLPPSAVGCLYEQEFASARYRHAESPEPHVDEHLVIDPIATKRFHEKYPQYQQWLIWSSRDKGTTPWIPVDPLNVDEKRYPLAGALNPIEVVVNAGEVLYLPSLWYHRAAHLCPTISVNYWHDMEFDCRYVYFNFVHDIGARYMALEKGRACVGIVSGQEAEGEHEGTQH